jgi:hypothetical protein
VNITWAKIKRTRTKKGNEKTMREENEKNEKEHQKNIKRT